MKLAKYLADYLETGINKTYEAGLPMDFTAKGLKPIIQQGIEAFVLTQGKSASIDVRKRCECGRFFKMETYSA